MTASYLADISRAHLGAANNPEGSRIIFGAAQQD